jgi:hypothetical protein
MAHFGIPGQKMIELSADQIKRGVENMHGGTATLAQTVPIDENFGGLPIWRGTVHVFDLAENPKATRAYAWSAPVEGSTKRRFFAMLHMGAIKSPVDAVRAAIEAERRFT